MHNVNLLVKKEERLNVINSCRQDLLLDILVPFEPVCQVIGKAEAPFFVDVVDSLFLIQTATRRLISGMTKGLHAEVYRCLLI